MEKTRCVNLDWLEVDVTELNQDHDPDYFRSRGFVVNEREYGTRVYEQMFTLLDKLGHPFMEVRRKPKTTILSPYDSHLRLVNRYCYFDNAASIMRDFIDIYEYEFNRIARVDICLDIDLFDDNTRPRVFMQRFMRGKFSKINQANIHSHGSDTWTGRVWNSVSWGSPTSDVGTKFYNKTLELYDPKSNTYAKPYIRQAWQLSGLVDNYQSCTRFNADGIAESVEIWRIEFSIRSSVKNWFLIERNGNRKEKQSIRNNLDMYDNREKLLTLFASLAEHYFHFKRYIIGQRKDRCPDRRLFNWKPDQLVYQVGRLKVLNEKKPSSSIAILISRLRDYQATHSGKELHEACNVLLRLMEGEMFRLDMESPWNYEELKMMRAVMREKTNGNPADVTVLMNEIKALLKLNDDTAPFL